MNRFLSSPTTLAAAVLSATVLFTTVLVSTAVWAADDESIVRVNELGPVRVTTSLSPSEPRIGDEVVLQIKVDSASGVDVLMPEFGEALSRYTILDFVPRQRVADDGSTTHTQRYTLQPYLSGEQAIPPILVEFVDHRPGQKPAPDDLDAYEILTDRIDFQVASVLPDDASGELNPPLGTLSLTPKARSRAWLWIPATVVGLAVLVAGFFAVRSRRRKVLRKNAYDVARSRLNRLLARNAPSSDSEIEAFFVEISAIIRRYLEDRFDLRAPELTTEEFLGVAGDSGALSTEHHSLLREFLRQADLVKFAGVHASSQELRTSTDLAIRFLEETRENAPWVEVTPTDEQVARASSAVRKPPLAQPTPSQPTPSQTAPSQTAPSKPLPPNTDYGSEERSDV